VDRTTAALTVTLASLVLGACWYQSAYAAQDGPYVTLGLGYEPHDYFSRISREGNPVSVMRGGWCQGPICLDLEHHSSAFLGGAQSERETDTAGLLLRWQIRRFGLEAGPALVRDRHLGGTSAIIGRIRYHIYSRFYLDYEHMAGEQDHVNLFSIVAIWHPLD